MLRVACKHQALPDSPATPPPPPAKKNNTNQIQSRAIAIVTPAFTRLSLADDNKKPVVLVIQREEKKKKTIWSVEYGFTFCLTSLIRPLHATVQGSVYSSSAFIKRISRLSGMFYSTHTHTHKQKGGKKHIQRHFLLSPDVSPTVRSPMLRG